MGIKEVSFKDDVKVLPAPIGNMTGEVRYKHLRLQVWDANHGDHTYNKGGVTLAYKYLTAEESVRALGREVQPAILVGFAGCSWNDNFDRKLGREIASKRLEKSQVVIGGEDNIRRLMIATDPMQVADLLDAAMAAQGLRLGLCG